MSGSAGFLKQRNLSRPTAGLPPVSAGHLSKHPTPQCHFLSAVRTGSSLEVYGKHTPIKPTHFSLPPAVASIREMSMSSRTQDSLKMDRAGAECMALAAQRFQENMGALKEQRTACLAVLNSVSSQHIPAGQDVTLHQGRILLCSMQTTAC